jgi:hypothetical protein
MTVLYDRQIEIKIGNENETLTIRDLRVTFKVEKDIFGIPNIAKFEIYNLAEETRSKIEKEFTKIEVNAGYVDNVSLLFSGQLTYIFHNRVRENIVTELYAADSRFNYINSFFSNTYSDSVQYSKIFDDVITTFDDVSPGDLSAIPEKNNSLFGSTFFAPSRAVLDNLCDDLSLRWYIENQKINVIEKNGTLSNTQELVFNQLNGMVGSPIITEIGINLTVLLTPQIRVGSIIEVETVNATVQLSNYFFSQLKPTKGSGKYRVDRVVHFGDNFGQNWITTIEGTFPL